MYAITQQDTALLIKNVDFIKNNSGGSMKHGKLLRFVNQVVVARQMHSFFWYSK